jgi:hypothetical protein
VDEAAGLRGCTVNKVEDKVNSQVKAKVELPAAEK